MSKLLELADRIEQKPGGPAHVDLLVTHEEREWIVLCLRAGDALQSLKNCPIPEPKHRKR